MADPIHQEANRSEILELAVAEGHDADIPTNVGSITSERKSYFPSEPSTIDKHPGPRPGDPAEAPKLFTSAKEKDLEKGSVAESSISLEDAVDEPVETDPNIVFWDKPDDPLNPMNWKPFRKWGTVVVVSAITFLTPLASSMFAPGVPEVMRTFHSTDQMLESFMVSVYVLGFCFGPLIIAPLSEMYGRLPLYHSCNLLFVVWTIAAAVAPNMVAFIIFRFLMGCFGGAPLVLGAGTIADIISREQRGTAMALWMMGPTLGPCVGPIIGGFLTQAMGWRWDFWFVAIVAGAFFIVSLILMRETSSPILLERKAQRLRKETGNENLRSKLASDLSAKDLFKFSIVRPAKMLTRSPTCFAISLFVGITYSYLYILFTTFTTVFTGQYGWSGGVAGLSFMGIGIGSLIGQFTFTHFGNKKATKHIERGDFKPEHRLDIMFIGGFFIPIGFFWYGWSVQAHTHFIVPILGTGFIGFGLLMTFMPANTYLVDVFTVHAASAMAANTVLRSFMAALIPLSAQQMYETLGYGWGNTLLGIIAALMIPMPYLFIRYGERVRARETVRL